MALVDVDSWITEYDACERLNHSILRQLTNRGKESRNSAEYKRLTNSIQLELHQFDTELKQLRIKLNEVGKSSTITFEELERRQRQLDTLQSQLTQLQTKYKNANRLDRIAELQAPTNWQTAIADIENPSSSNSNSNSSSNKNNNDKAAASGDSGNRIINKQRQVDDMVNEQNRGLEVLSQTISRQKQLATQLGNEVVDQNEILDNLTNNIDRVESGVSQETTNISHVNQRDKTCGYWIVIIILFIAIIVVSLI